MKTSAFAVFKDGYKLVAVQQSSSGVKLSIKVACKGDVVESHIFTYFTSSHTSRRQ